MLFMSSHTGLIILLQHPAARVQHLWVTISHRSISPYLQSRLSSLCWHLTVTNTVCLEANCQDAPCLLQGSSMQPRRRTGRRPTPTSLRPSRATTPSTAPEPSRRSNTCFCAKLSSTREFTRHDLWKVNNTHLFTCSTSLFLVFFRPEEVQALISGKLALRYAGRQARARHFLFNRLQLLFSCVWINPQL